MDQVAICMRFVLIQTDVNIEIEFYLWLSLTTRTARGTWWSRIARLWPSWRRCRRHPPNLQVDYLISFWIQRSIELSILTRTVPMKSFCWSHSSKIAILGVELHRSPPASDSGGAVDALSFVLLDWARLRIWSEGCTRQPSRPPSGPRSRTAQERDELLEEKRQTLAKLKELEEKVRRHGTNQYELCCVCSEFGEKH